MNKTPNPEISPKKTCQFPEKPCYFQAIQHNMKRRASWHNYRSSGFYMVTLVINGRKPLLGTLLGEPRPNVKLSNLGESIFRQELCKISRFYPNVQVRKTFFMPDHIHLILYVKENFPEGKNLGSVIGGFKSGCNHAYWNHIGTNGTPLFEPGYNDKIMLDKDRMQIWIKYLEDNPRRLWLKRTNPGLFTRHNNIIINGVQCVGFGNTHLLNYPDKAAVIIHRRYDDAVKAKLFESWMRLGANGGVLVGAWISQEEKAVFYQALENGYRIIQICDRGFPNLYKPGGKLFDSCANGNLLQLSPWPADKENKALTREACLYMNKLAEAIVNGSADTETPSHKNC